MLVFTRGPGVGQIPPNPFIDVLEDTIVTPAERIAQYSLIGAFAGLGIAAVLGFGLDLIPRASRMTMLGLLAVPAVGAAAGTVIAARNAG